MADHRANLALAVSCLSALVSFCSYRLNERTTADAQRVALFSTFQQQYNSVISRFPAGYLQPAFKPKSGTDEYGRLEAYWFFCFSEWYATHRVNADAYGDLWSSYYVPLIADGIQIPSLRDALEVRIRTYNLHPGDWSAFIVELARIARATGKPLAPDVERKLMPYGLVIPLKK